MKIDRLWGIITLLLQRDKVTAPELAKKFEVSCRMLDEIFVPREIPSEELDLDDYFTDENRITILFDKSLEYRLIEEYGPDCYMVMEDGSLKFSVGYTNRDYIVSWVLGFGDKARVVDPVDLANEIKNKAKNIILNYEHDI